MKRAVVFILAIMLVAAAFAQAPSGSLTVWSFTDEVEGLINNYFRRNNRNITINYSFTPIDQFERRLDPVLASGRNAPDVFALEAAFVRKYVESGHLLDLTDIYEANRNNLIRYLADIGTYNGRVYALSWQACPGAMFYRRSLARRYLGTDDPALVQKYFADFNAFMETAALLFKNSSGSCVVVPGTGDLANPFLGARSSPWIVNNRLVIDPVIEQYMDACKELRDNGFEGRAVQWSQEWIDGMNDELRTERRTRLEVFSYFLPTWGLHYVLKPNAYDTAGDWAMIPGPSAWRWGGTWIAAGRNTSNPEAARELIRFLTTDAAFLEQYALGSGDIVSSTAVMNRISHQFSEPFLGGQNHYAMFAQIAARVNGSLAQATDSTIENILMEEVASYLYGEKSKSLALADFRSQVERALNLTR
jgi:ABC-type glycerol-3-phosphate transport system substrate-binding protein